ncbi:MAG: 30S ribosomal protein S1 [Desulfobacterales bacterium]|nr:30S ribosomal protein S1 [Desulfobacterales bacterium]
MSDDINNEKEHEEESFADLFESYSAGMKDDLKVGDKIMARIISIGKNSVFLDTGTKVDGVVEGAELLDKDGNMPYHEGDEIELYVVLQNEHEIRLSKAISGVGGIELLQDAFASAIPVEGKVSATCKGGFHVEMLQRRTFCPISQIDVNFVETPEDYVGQTFQFLITQFEERGRNIVVSRRKLLAKAMEKEKEAFLETLNKGDLIEGRVTRLMPYGAFVELTPGLEGMVHISELSWSRVDKPDDIVQANDRVMVKVVDISESDKKNQKKIALSMKQVSGDPWDTVAEKIHAGDKVNGKVTRCMDFGAFVEIAPGIEGLVHVSEMSYVKRIIKPDDVVKPGEMVSVLVKELDPKGRRISLSLRAAEGDPWLEVSDKFRVGQIVTGTLEKKEKFGYFISLAPGITGLLPKSKISASEKPAAIEGLKVGDPLAVTVESIRLHERKISLAAGDATDEGAWKNFAPAAPQEPAGDLAEKLRQAMAEKNNK